VLDEGHLDRVNKYARLNGTILLGTKVATEESADDALIGNNLGEGLEDRKTKDSTGGVYEYLASDKGCQGRDDGIKGTSVPKGSSSPTEC
jgi:hypothetical protein